MRHYAEWNKSHRERQVQGDLAHIWTLKIKTKKQNWAHIYKEQIHGCQKHGQECGVTGRHRWGGSQVWTFSCKVNVMGMGCTE